MTLDKQVIDDKLLIFCSHTKDGNISYKYGSKEEASANRGAFYQRIGIDRKDVFSLKMPNQDIIVYVDKRPCTEHIEADAVISSLPQFFVATAFADCIPLVFYDKKKQLFGFAHLGWRSIALHLQSKLVDAMVEMGCCLTDLEIYLGPSIHKESYGLQEVSQRENPLWKPYITFKDGLYYLDLQGYVIDSLKEKGIVEEQLHVAPEDTGVDTQYFSHYRSVHTGEIEGRFVYGTGFIK